MCSDIPQHVFELDVTRDTEWPEDRAFFEKEYAEATSEVPGDMDNAGDFINDSTAPSIPDDEPVNDYDPTDDLFDALLSSAEMRALTA